MAEPNARTRRIQHLRLVPAVAATVLLLAGAGACSPGATGTEAEVVAAKGAAVKAPEQPAVEVATNLPGTTAVPVDTLVEVTATGGTLVKAGITAAGTEPVDGALDKATNTWTATDRLEPGTTYTLRTVTRDQAGEQAEQTRQFTTVDLGLDRQTYASIAPLEGETVGVGMPVVVKFDLPVEDRATFERNMEVTSTPRQEGSWHWISDKLVHYRPAEYWEPGTDVTVDLDINALPAGNGIYGQDSRHVTFHIGDQVISKVDAAAHRMQTFINGELVKSFPITTGKDGFVTRSGVKVIMEKFRTKRMNSETIGIPSDSAEGYDLADVEYAMRVTNSGEFIHAAPWSAGSQGNANVSHGCTGLSTADAKWLYEHSRRGDVVVFSGTDRPMTLYNGYGDWNASFADYAAGSAL